MKNGKQYNDIFKALKGGKLPPFYQSRILSGAGGKLFKNKIKMKSFYINDNKSIHCWMTLSTTNDKRQLVR